MGAARNWAYASDPESNSMIAATKTHAQVPVRSMCVCSVCLAIFFFAAVSGGTRSVWVVLGLLAAMLLVWLIWRALAKVNDWTKHSDFFAPGIAFTFAYIAWFSLGSANIFDMPDSFMGGVFSPIPASQWLFYILGLAGYSVAWLILRGKARLDPRKLLIHNGWVPRRFWILLTLIAAGMFSALALQVAQFGVPGLSTLAGEQRLAIRGIAHFVFVSCAFTVLVVTPAYLWTRPTSRGARVLAGALFLFTAFAVPLLQGGRSDLFVACLTIFILFHYLKKPATLFILTALAGSAVAILSIIGYLRDYFLTSGQGLEWLDTLGAPRWVLPIGYALLYVRYTVATFRDVISIIPSQVPYQHGALTFAAFNTPLPGHHEMSDMYFKTLLGSDFVGGGQPATLLGPLYADFGTIGIFVGMFLFGIVTAVAYRVLMQKQTILSVILYAWLVQTAFMSLFGSLFTYITTLSMPLFWLLFDRLASSKGFRDRAAQPSS